MDERFKRVKGDLKVAFKNLLVYLGENPEALTETKSKKREREESHSEPEVRNETETTFVCPGRFWEDPQVACQKGKRSDEKVRIQWIVDGKRTNKELCHECKLAWGRKKQKDKKDSQTKTTE
jgi:hypothetical protein